MTVMNNTTTIMAIDTAAVMSTAAQGAIENGDSIKKAGDGGDIFSMPMRSGGKVPLPIHCSSDLKYEMPVAQDTPTTEWNEGMDLILVSKRTLSTVPPLHFSLEKNLFHDPPPVTPPVHHNPSPLQTPPPYDRDEKNQIFSQSRYIRWKNSLGFLKKKKFFFPLFTKKKKKKKGNPRKNVWIFVMDAVVMTLTNWLFPKVSVFLLILNIMVACLLWCRIPNVSDIFYIRREVQYILIVGAYTCLLQLAIIIFSQLVTDPNVQLWVA
ncbi:hypothetical protein RFI_26838 [Reticulomyxa filosa]|uniref:Uncharacterized protein n=1 Tax=Reticulomyxa filosa TaxID=46433 RepID=X6M959_RETFI|nr:hypothetical protein RFI_26838 [Reticulomyxa filosa]|eukprot:ETO10538.1 hypothetical protein RFI_26838 [Reticulomyxa filosa]